MPPGLRKVSAGEGVVYTAEAWNAFVDAAQDYRRRALNNSQPEGDNPTNPATITLRNASGSAVGRFAILTIAGQSSIISPAANLAGFQDVAAIEGITPTAAAETFAVLLEPLPDDRIGEAVVAGAVQCQVNVTDAAHNYATTISGDDTKLVSQAGADGGVRILYKQSGTGTKWALVLLPVIKDSGSSVAVGQLSDVKYFTASGTWTKPANLEFVIVEVLGAGGGGGFSRTATYPAGQGGGAGSMSRAKIAAGSLGATESVTIGAGGAGGIASSNTDAADGGSSDFAGLVSGVGGKGGFTIGNGGSSLGEGGAASFTGDIDCPGQSGFFPDYDGSSYAYGGQGGSTNYGGGGMQRTGSVNGNPGTGYGSGGGGACNPGGSWTDGGAGADGLCIVWEYITT